MPTTYYRIVHRDVPTAEDFRTEKDLAKPLYNETYEREWAEGISVYSDRDYAIKRARSNRTALGRFVAPLAVPDDSGIEVKQTTRDRRHYTIYAHGDRARALVCGPTIRVGELNDD